MDQLTATVNRVFCAKDDIQAKLITETLDGRRIEVFANKGNEPEWWGAFTEKDQNLSAKIPVTLQGRLFDSKSGKKVFIVHKGSPLAWGELAAQKQKVNFSTELHSDLVDRVGKISGNRKGQIKRSEFVAAALEMYLAFTEKQALNASSLGELQNTTVDNWLNEHIDKIVSNSQDREKNEPDLRLSAILKWRAEELQVKHLDLVKEVLWDSIREQKGFWKVEVAK